MVTSKERVLAALDHRETDRVPLDLGGINNTCMHQLIERELKEKLGLRDNGPFIKAKTQGIVIPDPSVVDYFGVDTCSIYINETQPWRENPDGTFTDMWGIGRQLNPDGYYYNMCSHPLQDAEDVGDIEKHQFPEPNEYMLEGLAERIAANRDKCCILEGLEEPMFGMPSWLRGIENFYLDLLGDEEMCDALLAKTLAFYKKLIDFVMARIGDGIDIIKVADDMGTQASLLVSPEAFRERIKPYAAELYSHIRHTHKKRLLLHSCGAVRPLINDWIEMGVDALNPVQITADGMSPAELKAEFGDRITFWGGGVDTQSVLNLGTPDDVRTQVRENMRAFKPGGGYVFAQVHNIQPGVPLENILAMYETYREEATY